MKKLSFYDEAHIFVAAIRIFEFQKNSLPTHNDISQLTGMSLDRVSHIATKLRDYEIIEMTIVAFEKTGFSILDYQKIESLPREIPKSGMADEINRFREQSHNDLEDKVKAFKEEKKKKEKKLFEDLEKKLKKELEKKG